MAEDIKKLEAELKRIITMMGKLGMSGAKAAYAELEKAYAETLKGEDLVIKALPDARKNGVNGDDIKAFLRDPAFKKIFKEYDKTVDALDKAEKVCYYMSNSGDETVRDLDLLEARVKKEFKDLKDKDVANLLKDIAVTKKRAETAGDSYDIKRDKKMHEYATKFDKRVQFMLDLAPKAENPEPDLPSELEDAAMKSAEKLCLKQEKDMENMAKKVTAIIKAIAPFTRKGDLLVQKEVGMMEKLFEQMEKTVKHYEKLIKSNTKEIKRGHAAVDITAFMKNLEVRTEKAGSHLKEAQSELSDAQKSMKAAP